jgi:hypothetical protein
VWSVVIWVSVVAVEIDARIADVRDDGVVVDQDERADGRAHAASSGRSATVSMRTVAVEAMASCSACSASVGVANGWSRSFSRWTAMLDATSPPAWPPMPSATTKRFEPL